MTQLALDMNEAQPLPKPCPVAIRARLNRMLASLTDGTATEQDRALYRLLGQQMPAWLPDDEAARFRATFTDALDTKG